MRALAPSAARCKAAASVRFPTTKSLVPGVGTRSNPRTNQPALLSAATAVRPMRPAEPVTRMWALRSNCMALIEQTAARRSSPLNGPGQIVAVVAARCVDITAGRLFPLLTPMSHRVQRTFGESLGNLVPFGVGQTKPKHFRDMLRVAWKNRDNLRY